MLFEVFIKEKNVHKLQNKQFESHNARFLDTELCKSVIFYRFNR